MLKLKTKNVTEPITLRQLPTMRQAFIVAALLILLAFALSAIVHPGWIYLALLPAFGLLFSGVTGTCPMIFFLQLLPCNRPE